MLDTKSVPNVLKISFSVHGLQSSLRGHVMCAFSRVGMPQILCGIMWRSSDKAFMMVDPSGSHM